MSSLAPSRDAGPADETGARVARMYRRHARALYGLCVMLLRDPHEAEDALQSTFLSAHGALVRGGAPRDESAWLAAIARNECRGRIRRRMEIPLHDDPTALDELPDPRSEPAEMIPDPRVQQALAALSETQREAVVLRDVLGLRAREVGAALGLSLPAVEALVFRARRQLRLRLRPAGMLVVPAAVGHALAQAIPGFVAPAAAAGLAGSAGGAAGVGLLAKLTATPTAAKLAAGLAATAAAGSVAVELDRRPMPHSAPTPPPAVSASAAAARQGVPESRTAPRGASEVAPAMDHVARTALAVLLSPTTSRSGRETARTPRNDDPDRPRAPREQKAAGRDDDARGGDAVTHTVVDVERSRQADPGGDDSAESAGTGTSEAVALEDGEAGTDGTDREKASSGEDGAPAPSAEGEGR